MAVVQDAFRNDSPEYAKVLRRMYLLFERRAYFFSADI